jgi:integrase
LRYRNDSNKTSYMRIGSTSDVTLADARKEAKRLKAEIALGVNPKGEPKKVVLTFSEFFNDHYLPYVTPRKRSWKRDEELYRLRIKKVFGDKKLDAITRQEIQTFHTALLAEGLAPASADHHLKLMKHAYNLAIDWDLHIAKNPAARIPQFSADNRVNNLLDDPAMHRLLEVLHTDANRSVCGAALLSLHSGCRLQEALSARWDDIDFENKQWRISSAVAKGKRSKVLPLADSAIEVLMALASRGKNEYLFVNMHTGEKLTTISKVWSRLRNLFGQPHYRYHDLRHQYGTNLAREGRSTVEIQHLLFHRSPITTQRYLHLSTSDLLAATNSASSMIQRGRPVANSMAGGVALAA